MKEILKINKNNVVSSPNYVQLIYLTDWSFVEIKGKDSKKYLQGLITYNINALKTNQHILCAQCKINGKVLSILRLFKYNNHYAYIQRTSVNKIQLDQIKKYSIFSDTKINFNKTICLLGIIGKYSNIMLLKIFKTIPNKKNPICHENDVTLLWFNKPFERFLIIIDQNNPIILKIKKLITKINNNTTWLALDILSKFPIIDLEMSGKFLPQSLNLIQLKGLDFKKGCYHGQEIVSKTYFKKLNKYDLHWLFGKSISNPKIGSIIEIKKENEKFYSCGVSLSVVRVDKINIWIQAILKKNINYSNQTLKIKDIQNSYLYFDNSKDD